MLERLDERRLLEIDRSEALPNCSFTRYTREEGGALLGLVTFGATSHLAAALGRPDDARGASAQSR